MLSLIETNQEVVIGIDSELGIRYNSEHTCSGRSSGGKGGANAPLF